MTTFKEKKKQPKCITYLFLVSYLNDEFVLQLFFGSFLLVLKVCANVNIFIKTIHNST